MSFMSRKVFHLSVGALIFAVLLLAGSTLAQEAEPKKRKRPEPKKTMVGDHIMYTLMKPGAIPAITDPEFMAVDEADSMYFDNEQLMVVTSGADVRGYSTLHLEEHEIVNDVIKGRPIAVTW